LTGCTVICLDYKLAPEYPLPYAVNELLALYEYVLTDLKIPASKIAMSGGSAGGGMVLLALQELARRQEQKSEVFVSVSVSFFLFVCVYCIYFHTFCMHIFLLELFSSAMLRISKFTFR
jgi:acetyl esterase/lipase